jgi:hypothetical protein
MYLHRDAEEGDNMTRKLFTPKTNGVGSVIEWRAEDGTTRRGEVWSDGPAPSTRWVIVEGSSDVERFGSVEQFQAALEAHNTAATR